MIPKTAPCRCGREVEIRGGANWTRCAGVERTWWWAGGECLVCGRVVQYGYGGEPSDYMHGRFWYIGKHAEGYPGKVRRWPAEWGFTEHTGSTVQ